MKFRKFLCTLLACVAVMGCLGICAGAAELEENVSTISIARASGRFSMDVPANTLLAADKSFSMDAGEEISINASYSPRSASVDFGLIAPDGLFYSVNGTDGTVDYTFEISERGSYTLAVRNNSSNTVSVAGFVNY